MAYTIDKVFTWVAEMSDEPGALAARLRPLADAGANLECIIARRAWNKPGAVVFVAPVAGAAQIRVARANAFEKALGMHSLRVAGPDRPGLAVEITEIMAAAGVNIRGWNAHSAEGRCVIYFAFATTGEADKARRALRKQLATVKGASARRGRAASASNGANGHTNGNGAGVRPGSGRRR